MQNKITYLLNSNIAFAVMSANGMMDYRDWFIAACTHDKKLMKKLGAKKNRKLRHIYEIPMSDADLEEFEGLKNCLFVRRVSDFGVVYENPNNPLKKASLQYKLEINQTKYEMLESRYLKTPTDLIFNQMEQVASDIKKLKKQL